MKERLFINLNSGFEKRAGKLVFAFGSVTLAVAAIASACSESGATDNSAGDVDGRVQLTEVKGVALAAIDAFLKGDEEEFASYIRPDEKDNFRGFESSFGFGFRSLSGCQVSGSDVLVENQGAIQGTRATIVFRTPCGYNDVLNRSYRKCSVNLIRLSGRWYLNYIDQPSCG